MCVQRTRDKVAVEGQGELGGELDFAERSAKATSVIELLLWERLKVEELGIWKEKEMRE